MVRWLTAALATFVLLVAHAALPIGAAAQNNPAPQATTVVNAAAGSLAVAQQCSGGADAVTFSWSGNDPSSIQQWVDLSTVDGNFYPGQFISAGPFGGYTNSYTWYGLAGGMTHYVRINQQLYTGAWDAGIFTFNTNFCGGAPIMSLQPSGPVPGPFNPGGPASILNVTCTSSTATATLSNVGPASTQNAGLNALPFDTINCTANVAGGQPSWLGPNNDAGYSTQFSTQIGGPKPAGAPYDISLTLNWGGNPAIAHISVTPIQPNIYNPYNPYNPYPTYNQYPQYPQYPGQYPQYSGYCPSGGIYINGSC